MRSLRSTSFGKTLIQLPVTIERTRAPQAESEASEKVISARRDLPPIYFAIQGVDVMPQKINLGNGILRKQYFTVPRNSTADHREEKSRHNTCNRTHAA